MKAQVLFILAATMLIPFVARTQIEGAKPDPGGRPPQVTGQETINQDLASIQTSQSTGGGGAAGNYMVYDQSGMYLEPGWAKGYVVLKDKSMLEDIQLRYDLYNQQMQFVREGDTLAFSNPGELDYL
jgi:hypothetical protein